MKKEYFIVTTDRNVKRKIFFNDVIYIRADGSYSEIYFTNNKKITLSRLIKTFMFLETDYNFYRVSRSYIINLDYCIELWKPKKPCVIMANEYKIFINKKSYKELLKMEFI